MDESTGYVEFHSTNPALWAEYVGAAMMFQFGLKDMTVTEIRLSPADEPDALSFHLTLSLYDSDRSDGTGRLDARRYALSDRRIMKKPIDWSRLPGVATIEAGGDRANDISLEHELQGGFVELSRITDAVVFGRFEAELLHQESGQPVTLSGEFRTLHDW